MMAPKADWILGYKNTAKPVVVIRWIARAWSLFALALALLIAFSPDPHATQPPTGLEIFMLSLWGLAILGLILAWRWEQVGALITLFTMPIREILFFVIYREWTINFLLIWALVVPPAVLFLVVWHMDRKNKINLSETDILEDIQT
jgi:hypothetical protein